MIIYKKLFFLKVLTNTVFSTISLEDQQVPKTKIAKIIKEVLKEMELKGNQFFTYQLG